MTGTRVVLVTATAVALLGGSATAATPKHGDYVDHGNGKKTVIDLNVFTDQKTMQPNFFNKCADVPARYDVKIKPNGKFSFDAPAKDINGKRLKISIEGSFVSSRRATGTVDYDSGGCNGKPVDFDARFEGVISRTKRIGCTALRKRYDHAVAAGHGAKAAKLRQKMVNKGCQNLPPPATPGIPRATRSA